MSQVNQADKLNQVLEAVEYPEKFSDEQLQQLLSDETCAEYYRLMCDAASAYAARPAVPNKWTWRRIAAVVVPLMILSAISYAAIRWIGDGTAGSSTVQSVGTDTIVVGLSPTGTTTDSVYVFQDAALQDILSTVAGHYHLRVDFRREQTRHIRLYIKWDTRKDVTVLLDRLNKFDKVSVRLEADLLIVE